MVVAGVHEGKNEICARIGYFNLGINLKTELPSAEELRIAIKQVFADNKYSENVKKLAGEFRQYNPNELGEQYVAELVGTKKIAATGSYNEVEIVY